MKFYLLLLLSAFSCSAEQNARTTDKNIYAFISNLDFLETIPRGTLKKSVARGIWNIPNSAFAFCVKQNVSTCLVLIKKKSGYKVIDVTPVEAGNFGKLGRPASYYEKYETVATKWFERRDELYQIKFSTYAWYDNQRYTVSEPLIISKKGEPFYR